MEVVSFSDLQLRGKSTIEAWLGESASRALVVRRRDAEDLVLTTAARAQEEQETSSATARLFVALMHDPHVQDLVIAVLPEVFPWVTFLCDGDVHRFVGELVTTIKAAESIANPAPVAEVIRAWRHTAEVLADPTLSGGHSKLDRADTPAAPQRTRLSPWGDVPPSEVGVLADDQTASLATK